MVLYMIETHLAGASPQSKKTFRRFYNSLFQLRAKSISLTISTSRLTIRLQVNRQARLLLLIPYALPTPTGIGRMF